MRREIVTLGFAVATLAMTSAAQAAKPNFVIVLTDDQQRGLVTGSIMPTTVREIVNKGATFTRAQFNDPLCSPSRATLLSGRYAQNTGVTGNEQVFTAEVERQTIAVRLKAAGYRTGYVGKYLNAYSKASAPPGWDDWHATSSSSFFYDYRLSENGTYTYHGDAPGDYSTDVLGRKAAEFVAGTPAGKPFLLVLGVRAPPEPAGGPPRYAGLYGGLPLPQAARPDLYPDFDEADVSDKPAYVRTKGPLSASFIAAVTTKFREKARAMRAVDDAVARVLASLSATPGRLADTHILFLDDNGWRAGEHRLGSGKGDPYQATRRIQMYMRGPGIPAGSRVSSIVSNADIAPTILNLAGVSSGSTDGRSFAALVRGQPSSWRRRVPISYRAGTAGSALVPGYKGFVETGRLFVEYDTGERELYDLNRDPFELRNLAGTTDPATLALLRTQNAALQACAAATCRTADSR